jgi:hypothetical protein
MMALNDIDSPASNIYKDLKYLDNYRPKIGYNHKEEEGSEEEEEEFV